MEAKVTCDFLKVPRCNSVCTDDSGSEIHFSGAQSSNSEAIIYRNPRTSYFGNAPQSERNKTLLLFKSLPIYGKLLFSMLCMIIVNFFHSSIKFYIIKNTSRKDVDLYSICGFIGVIPHIFVYLLGILVEGKISRSPSLMECLSICFSGLIIYGVMPLTYFNLLVHSDSIFILLIEIVMITTVCVGSYVFKVEKLPKFENPGTVILFSGLPISLVISSIFIFEQMNYDEIEKIPFQNKITIIIITFVLFLTLGYARNYQYTRFLKNQRSVFHEKPITFVGISGILASPILLIVYSATTIVRWNYVKDQFWTTQYWIFVAYGTIVFGIFMNILLILAFTITSPLYAHCFFPFKMVFDLIFQYIFFEKKVSVGMYTLSVLGASSAILAFIGKYKQLRQNTY